MKILCLGNNTDDTDLQTSNIAEQHGLLNQGLIDSTEVELLSGCYHTSVCDLQADEIVYLSAKFDKVLVLDQPKDSYFHPNSFLATIQVGEKINAKFLNKNFNTNVTFFSDLVQKNKSFCIFPFIELISNNNDTTVCCRSTKKVTSLDQLTNFQTDPHYEKIRNDMLAGKLIPEHCLTCYKLESKNIISARQEETIEWTNRLNLQSLNDLKNITDPVYYEIRPGNICNLQCRMCSPQFSHLIAKEYAKLNLDTTNKNYEYTGFEIINFDSIKKLYVAGGEPLVTSSFYEFVNRCIENNKTNFQFVINTNATKLSDKFKKQMMQFDNMEFIVSIDGYDRLNDYIRWGSKWGNIVNNVQFLIENNKKVTVNVTVSIYNVSQLYDLFEYIDITWPECMIHCQFAEVAGNVLSANNYPNNQSVISNLNKIKDLGCYKRYPMLQSFIDSLIYYYQNNSYNKLLLQKFYEFNDKLDQSRNVALRDYHIELDTYRDL